MTIKSKCPICATKAAFEGADFGRRKRFDCPECGGFVITIGAEAKLLEAPQSWRDKLKAMIAAAPAGKVLEIRLSPVHNRQEGTGYQALDTEYIPL